MARPTRRRALLAAGLLALAALALLLWRPEPAPATGAWLARAGLEPRFAEVNGLRLRYLRAGAGPPLVLLHGFASSIYSWAEVLPALARDHDVVAMDLPGFGGSALRPDLTADDLVAAVPALMDQLGLARARLVGHSLGGAVAATVSVRHPERVQGLVLVDAAGFNFASADRPWLLRLLASPPGALFEVLPVRRRVVALGLRQVFHDDSRVTPERVDEYTAPLLRPGTVKALRSILHSPDTLGLPQSLGRIRQPTLVVWGADDTWIPLSDAARFVAAIPGSRQVVIPACGHLPQEEQPQPLIAALLSGPGR
ncbi:MAG TPA: alpha/beta fold hydrolase [Vicinamibacteria bacterium]